ncbi:MAG: hypothetical protein HRT43_11325 [Campylobacteraceae bacterium]|nr:hypothetical protein [Campylobacteraceae bacterium]
MVDFDTYQQFITLYAHDLIEKSQDFETDENLELSTSEQNNTQVIVPNDIVAELETQEIEKEIDSIDIKHKPEEKIDLKSQEKDKTNWMNVLLKGM